MKLRELAHVRCGDKGDVSNATVVAYDGDAYAVIEARLTAARVGEALAPLAEGPVTRYELPQLNAFNFVVENALGGGVTRSLRMDGHGKSLSSALLGIELQAPDEPDLGD